MAKKTDKKILDLIALATKKKEAIGKAEKPNWKTNCSFSYSHIENGSSRINLQVENNIPKLIHILAFLMAMSDSFIKGCNVLGLNEQFTWYSYTLEDWQSDIETRITKIQLKKEKDSLEEIEKRLSNLISPELRAQIEMEELEKLLS
jgi:hypothetical protein